LLSSKPSRAFHLLAATVCLSSILDVTACEQARRVKSVDQSASDTSVVGLLLARVSEQLSPTVPMPDPTDLHVVSSPSTAVRGLEYSWAVYRPKESADAAWYAVVGTLDGHRLVLRESADWSKIAADWRPASSAEAVSACGELIATTGPLANPVSPPFVYRRHQVMPRTILGDTSRLRRLREPSAVESGGDSSWEVTVWVLEPGRTAEYQCSIASSLGSHVRLLDSLPGVGLPPLGP
jgi:hypothetical protein